jgi:hypothetical protein
MQAQDSVARTEVIRATPHGLQIRRQVLAGAGFGSVHYRHQFEDLVVEDPEAVVWCTRFPSRQLVTDQAYQLLGHECEYLLETNSLNWSNLESGNFNTQDFDAWLEGFYTRGGTNPA